MQSQDMESTAANLMSTMDTAIECIKKAKEEVLKQVLNLYYMNENIEKQRTKEVIWKLLQNMDEKLDSAFNELILAKAEEGTSPLSDEIDRGGADPVSLEYTMVAQCIRTEANFEANAFCAMNSLSESITKSKEVFEFVQDLYDMDQNAVSAKQVIKEEIWKLLQDLDTRLDLVKEAFYQLISAEASLLEFWKVLAYDTISDMSGAVDGTGSKLSTVALAAIMTSTGPMHGDYLRNFLMEAIWSKPNPPVLPIIRQYTHDIPGVLQQLGEIRDKVKRFCRRNTDEERRLDLELKRRINRMIDIIVKENQQESEESTNL